MFQLRDYQKKIVLKTVQSLVKNQKVLVSAPTGA